MSEPFIGQIQTFGFNFAPRAWAFCNGQLLPISQNNALFALIGTIYGGDGRTTFALPDLRGRMPMHYGQGSGLSNRQIGQSSGAESHQLSVGELPVHTHTHNVTAAVGDSPSPVGAVPATANDGESNYSTATSGLSAVNGNSQGGGQAHNNMPPYLAINFSIALTGIFPPRN
ncbi:tail fiber protein [bacterium]|nr:tail fiber protein [bacterium]